MDGSINDEFNLDFEEVYHTGGGGTNDFNQLTNRPQYNGQTMTGSTNIPEVKNYTSGAGILIEANKISVDTDVIATKSDIPIVPDVVQTTGQDTGDVMSQKATTDAISSEATARANADLGLQGQIDALAASSDVTDIVGTKSDLNSYDTSQLKDNDIIKVLQDESQNNETTYYRWSTSTESFTLIGEEGPYYTKSAADQKFQEKLVAGSNISIAADGKTISATDTTYSAFTGTDGETAGTSGLVPAPATTDAGKFLKADGTWDTAGGASFEPTILTSADYNYPADNPTWLALWLLPTGYYRVGQDGLKVRIHTNMLLGNVYSGTAFYIDASPSSHSQIITLDDASGNTNPVGYSCLVNKSTGVAYKQNNNYADGLTFTCYDSLNSNDTRIPLSAKQGKVLNDKIEGRIITGAGAPTTSTVGTVGKLYEDTTNGKLYQCTAVSGNTYTWTEVGAGGGGGGDTVYSGVTTSNSNTGGAVYIGNLDSNQVEQADPTTTDSHYKYFWSLPENNTSKPYNKTINIMGTVKNGISVAIGGTVEGQNGVAVGFGADCGGSGIAIGQDAKGALDNFNNSVSIGRRTIANASYSIHIGSQSSNSNGIRSTDSTGSIAIGRNSKVENGNNGITDAIALGSYSLATRSGELNIGTNGNNKGFNSTDYRLISGVHDGQDIHDCATVAQGNTLSTSAPTTSTVGVLGQLYTDTTNMHTYQLTAIDDVTDPSNPVYTWTQRW